MLFDTFSESLISIVFDKIKESLKVHAESKELKRRLSEFISKYQQQFELLNQNDEFDLQGLLDNFNYLHGDIDSFLFGKTKEEREAAKNIIKSKAKYYANTKTKSAEEQVDSFVNSILSVLSSYILETANKDSILTAKILSDELSPQIDDIGFKLSKIQNELSYSPIVGINQDDIQKAQSGDNSSIELKIKCIQNAIAGTHPVKGYQNKIIGENILSVPVSPEAEKYPPKIKAKVRAFLGGNPIDFVDEDTLDYAYRHQLNIGFIIDEAEKYLGEIRDPNQCEAKASVGDSLVVHPKPFPPAELFCVYCDDQLLIDNLLLRIQEIMDDETIILSNKEQENVAYIITIHINDKTKIVNLSFSPKQIESAQTSLVIQKILLGFEMGRELKFMFSKNQEVLMTIKSSPQLEEVLELRRFRIETLENIIVLEQYFNTTLSIPEKIAVVDCQWIIFCGRIIKGEIATVPWSRLDIPLTVTETTKSEFKNGIQDYTYIGSISVKMWERDYDLPIAITYKNAQIKDADRVLNIINQLEIGDTFNISLISSEEKGISIYQLYSGNGVHGGT